MNNQKTVPTLYEWMGGMQAIEKLFVRFYEKVLADPLLGPVFRHMSPEHQIHVSHFVAEVFGGPKLYSGHDGSHYSMIRKHLGKHLGETHRKQWVSLLVDTADEQAIPSDPEFRSALVSYLEWGTRIAVINSTANDTSIATTEPMPSWGWGEVGGPYVP
ncbi:MAG: globin [Chitinophagaceae bacterium]|nr:MAG: globin [Chitinophagaceae bacterium]